MEGQSRRTSSREGQLQSDESNKQQSKVRSKRPEIQRYVPKGRLLEQQQKDADGSWEEDTAASVDSPNVSPRKIDLGNVGALDVKITVVNDKSPVKTQGPINTQNNASINAEDVATENNPLSRITNSPKSRDTNRYDNKDIPKQRDANKYDNKEGHSGRYGDTSRQGSARPDNTGLRNRGRGGFGANRGGRGNVHTGNRQQKAFTSNRDIDGQHSHQISDDSYGTWPRERGDKRKSGQHNKNTSSENWDEDTLPTAQDVHEQGNDSTSDLMVRSATELPKPQRTNQRRQISGGTFTPRDEQNTNSLSRSTSDKALEQDEDDSVIPTMVFERRNSGSSLKDTSGSAVVGAEMDRPGPNSNLKQKPPMGQTSNKGTPKRYSLSTMRRPRAGSISSDVSNASDLSIDEETTTKILDWDKEVEREMAQNIQDETLKLQEYLKNEGNFPTWEADINSLVSEANRTHEQEREKGYSDDHGDRGYRGNGRGYRPSNSNSTGQYDRSRRNYRSHSKEGRFADDASDYSEKRSRRKDRRKGSLNGRKSRDSSASSVHSVQSYHGEDGMYGGSFSLPRKGRHRRTSSNSSLKDFDNNDSMNLKITFAQNEHKRQVSVQNQYDNKNNQQSPKGRGRGRGRARSADRNSDRQRLNDDRNNQRYGQQEVQHKPQGKGNNQYGRGQSSSDLSRSYHPPHPQDRHQSYSNEKGASFIHSLFGSLMLI